MSNFQKIKIMKKIFFTAAVAVSGLVMVSCEADAIDSAIPQAKNFRVQKKGLEFNERDTIALFNTSTPMASEGPGDEIIIITPPKKPE
jgi:hypothetical protein